jgi:hypothetical protein
MSTTQKVNADPANQWTFKVQAQQLKRQFIYKGSQISPIAKVVMNYKKTFDTGAPHDYESIWCHDGNALGLERRGPFGVKRGEIVQIEVEQRDYTEEENKAIACALMRVALDAYQHFCPIIAITVPAQTFNEICNELRNKNCQDFQVGADQSYSGGVLFNMKSEPAGSTQRLFYKSSAGPKP